MKMYNRLIMLIAVAAAFSSCNKTINGSGNFKDESRIVDAFTSIVSQGDFNVIITRDSLISVSIHAEDNILPEIETIVEGSQLIIRYRDYDVNINDGGVTVYIHGPVIDGLNIQGSGNITSDDVFDLSSASLNISGSGNIDYHVNCNNLVTNISGSGNITVSGTAINATHTISGSGNIHAYNLLSSITTVNISGSGNCEVNVSDELHVTISGSGDVIYKGNPVVTSNISGSGHVKPF